MTRADSIAKSLADELARYRATLQDQLNKNHLEVCQRLTTIETSMKMNQETYGDIPVRIRKLEKFDAKVKVIGSIGATGLGAAWTGLLIWLRKA